MSRLSEVVEHQKLQKTSTVSGKTSPDGTNDNTAVLLGDILSALNDISETLAIIADKT